MILCKPEQCTGCTACFNACPHHCIRMDADSEGFLHPIIDENLCVKCGICASVCPVLHPTSTHSQTNAFAAMNSDEATRLASTSGGVFSLLAQWALKRGGVIFGAAYDQDFSVVHQCISSLDELSHLRTAKYAQSRLSNCFQQVKDMLDEHRYVLFSGTPCQIAGLHHFLGKRSDHLILVDLICHGVPSPSVWKRYIDYRKEIDAQGQSPCAINLRHKETGWASYSIRFEYPGGKFYSSKNAEDPFLQCFVHDLCLRPSCYQCICKGISRISDFTLGDYWGIWSQLPNFNDNKGASLVLIHTDFAREIWREIEPQLKYRSVSLPKCLEENPSAVSSSPMPEQRSAFMSRYSDEDFAALVHELLPSANSCNQSRSFFSKFKQKIRRMIY